MNDEERNKIIMILEHNTRSLELLEKVNKALLKRLVELEAKVWRLENR